MYIDTLLYETTVFILLYACSPFRSALTVRVLVERRSRGRVHDVDLERVVHVGFSRSHGKHSLLDVLLRRDQATHLS